MYTDSLFPFFSDLYSELNSWSTASSYGLIHSVAILYASSLPLTKASDLAAFFFATGLPLFSEGSSALCLTRVGSPIRKILEPAVFFGALSFIVGGLLCLTPRPYKWQETESKGEYLSFFYIGLMMLSRLFASLSRLFNCFRPLVICFSSLVYSHLTASMYATNPHCPNLESVTSDYEID